MLMMLCRDLWSNINFMSVIEGLIGLQAVCVDDTGCFHFKLDRTVEGKVEVETILIIGYRTNGRDDELSIAGNVYSHVSEIGMLVENTCIFFTEEMSAIEHIRS